MITAAKNCGCPVKTDFRSSQNFQNDPASEKCNCPKPNEQGYQKMNGACNPCCGNVEPSQEDKNEEKKSKIVSEIVERGLPYKEIEAIINNNRMIIRVQKDSSNRDEWDPPCDCNEENRKPLSQQMANFKQNENVSFRKVDLSQCNESPCRNITVYPHADPESNQDQNFNKTQKEKEADLRMLIDDKLDSEKKNQSQQKPIKSIDLEENPNIFLLRIKKSCITGDGKYNIDLEFRAPRPWLPKPIVKKPTPPPVEAVAESKSAENGGKEGKGGKGKKGKKGKK